jgi:5'-AMP-activated protein kinase, regulatory gamma subunit
MMLHSVSYKPMPAVYRYLITTLKLATQSLYPSSLNIVSSSSYLSM